MTRQARDIVLIENQAWTIAAITRPHEPGLWGKFKSLAEPLPTLTVYPTAKKLGMKTAVAHTALRRGQLHVFEVSGAGRLALR